MFKLNGYVFDSAGWADSLPAIPQIAAANGYSMLVPIDLQQKYPQIVMPLNATSIAFNRPIMEFTDSVWAQAGAPPQSNPSKDMSTDHELDYAFNPDASPVIISISFELDRYEHAAVHGEGQKLDFNWNILANRPLSADDIFVPGKDWRSALDMAAATSFANVLCPPDGSLTKEQADADFTNPQSWAVLRTGLRIDTASYEICPLYVRHALRHNSLVRPETLPEARRPGAYFLISC